MEKRISIETLSNLKMLLSSQIRYISVKRGMSIAGSGDFHGYGCAKMLSSVGIFEIFFFAKETPSYGNEILWIELKKSDDKDFFDTCFSYTIDLQMSFSKIIKIEIFGERYSIGDISVNTEYLLIFEDENHCKFSIQSSGVFNDEFIITFNEKEINNKFDLKREDHSSYYVRTRELIAD